jgi:3',5'-cyclic AMP phosphodiesterase CpdA
VKPKTLAHLSDLHLGRSLDGDRVAARLCEAVVAGEIDHVVVTGDVTHRGRLDEAALFFRLFGELAAAGRLSVVPGNHDRLGDDVGAALMAGGRVEVAPSPGLHLVRIDSTAPHNRFLLAGHGEICRRMLDEVEAALAAAPSGALVALALHHHPVPLPTETWPESLATRLGWPWASELGLGRELIELASGRCDLVLHGHRHTPRALRCGTPGARPMALFNAGSSTALGGFRVFTHVAGALVGRPFWMGAEPDREEEHPW